MTDSAPGIAPDLVGKWTMEVIDPNYPSVTKLTEIDIYYQDQGIPDSSLYGSVNSQGPETSKYALESGAVTNSQDICFDVTMSGQVFQFSGTIKDPESMYGTVTALVSGVGSGSGTEEGSWSAQAQGGGQD